MKAIVCPRYGSPEVLRVEEVVKPTPKDNEVLLKIHATGLNAADWHIMRGDPYLLRLAFGLRKPKFEILGADVAGRIEAVGKNVRQFKVGDDVFGDLSGCGFGGLTEFAVAPESSLVLKPTTLSYEQAAAIPMAAVTALQGLRDKGFIQAGQQVLINGASGGVGTFAVQLAKSFGAEVTAVCSKRKMELVRSLGADHVIDYTHEDFTKGEKRYDLILAANGYHHIMHYQRALKKGGRYVMTGGADAQIFQVLLLGPLISIGSSKKLSNLLAQPNQQDLLFLKALVESGKVAPVIDRQYTLNEVPSAMRYLEEGHAKGKIVIKMNGTASWLRGESEYS